MGFILYFDVKWQNYAGFSWPGRKNQHELDDQKRSLAIRGRMISTAQTAMSTQVFEMR